MKLHRFEVAGLAHYSYIVESGKNAIVIDPRRDIDIYVDFATRAGLRLTHVLETHIHADFASGARALAAATGAELWLSDHDRGERYEYGFEHTGFRDGQEFRFGDISVAALHTPGHTPEHLSFVIRDESRGRCPAALISGDFVFVGAFGRPDLLGDEAKHDLASRLFDSVHQKLGRLPDGIEVYPAHGAGSMCGAGMAERPQTTLGYERACNPLFGEPDREKFIQHLLTHVPPFPDYYLRMKKLNADGPPTLTSLPGEHQFSPEEFRARIERDTAIVVDLRTPEAFGGAHIPGSLNIGASPLLPVWAAWVVPYDTPILLVADDPGDYEYARRSLVRVGLDDIHGCLKGGIQAWIAAGCEVVDLPQVPVTETRDALGRGAWLLDVRGDNEWQEGHVAGAHHLFAGSLLKNIASVPKDVPVLTMCGGGYRASLAASLLQRAGFKQVANVAGGMSAWKQRGLPVVTASQDVLQSAAPGRA